MRRIQNSVLRLSILACLTVAGIAVTSVASADCTNLNTCYGAGALSGDTGERNSAFGLSALGSNTGSHNTAVGFEALGGSWEGLNSGSYNTAVGLLALVGAGDSSGHWQNGDNNTAHGALALAGNSTGNNNTAVGVQALSGAQGDHRWQDGSYNTAIGSLAMVHNGTGSYNTASGGRAMQSYYGGSYNTATGYQALLGSSEDTVLEEWNALGNYNTANGAFALQHNDKGNYNTASGSSALFANTTGGNNTATGNNALYSNTTGNYNTADGGGALKNATTGVRNVAMGYQAGFAVTTGSDNIILGAANQGVATENGVIRIGNKTYQKKAFIAGIRGVKTGSATASTVFVDVNGQLGTIKSSRRYKEEIQSMGNVSEKLFGLRPVTFRYTQPFDDGSKPVQYGLIAEEVAEVMPELVVYGEDGKPETVSYHLLATLLLNEVQKDHRVIQAQADQLAALRRDNESNAMRMAALEQQVAVFAKAAERAEKDRLVASTK